MNEEILRVTPDGEFFWHNNADKLIETGDFTEAPAMPHILRRLRRLSAVEAQRDALLEALKGMLHRDERNTCRHEETHRGGAIWEICDSCGAMWADDEGGKPEWEDPKEWTQARAAIKAVEDGR